MLDDDNVLNQFYVRDFLREYKNEASRILAQLTEWASGQKQSLAEAKTYGWTTKSKVAYERLVIVAEDGAVKYRGLKLWLDKIKTTLKLPVILTNKLEDKVLTNKTLVLAEETWFDEVRGRNLVKEALKHKVPTFGTLRGADNLSETLFCLVASGVVSLAQVRKFFRTQAEILAWADTQFGPELSVARNFAKQSALFMVGKTVIFTTTYENQALAEIFVSQTRCLAHNLAFSEELVEQMKGGRAGWLSHPVEKPFATFAIEYDFSKTEKDLLKQRERQLSGLMPVSRVVKIEAENRWQAALKAEAMATYVAAYLAVLNKRSLKAYSIDDN